jgi:hypothetical protein
MRGMVAKAVRKQFAERLKHELPQFRPIKSEHLTHGERLFEWKAAPALFFFLMLQTDDHNDEFTVEVAWSSDGQFPILSINTSPCEKARGGKMRFRLCNFWTEEDEWFRVCSRPTEAQLKAYFFEGKDYYADSPEEAAQRVPALIEEAIQRILEHAVPYFRKIVAERGQRLPEKA